MSKKCYVSKRTPSLLTYVVVNGKQTAVRFKPKHHGASGCFETDNAELQSAMEKDSAYGHDFVCTESADIPMKMTRGVRSVKRKESK